MSEENWEKFIKSILTGCTFSIDYKRNIPQKDWRMCNFTSRYYLDPHKNIKYYHVTNDDRRKIQRFITKRWTHYLERMLQAQKH
jgi:hypothetical protein